MLQSPPSRSGDQDGRSAAAGSVERDDGAGRGIDGVSPQAGTDPADTEQAGVRPTTASGSGATVAALFDELAPVYDRVTRLVSFGRDGRWRAAVVTASGVAPGDAVIDVAAGTGKLAAALADRVGPFGHVVALDLSPAMVERGAASTRDIVQLEHVVGDAHSLPFEDGRFDAATIAFGLATLADQARGLAEISRVVRPGGRVVCLDRVMPRPLWWGRTYRAAVRRLAPVAGAAAGRREAYRQFAESADTYPQALELSHALERAGLVAVSYRRFWLGSVALHVGTKPGS